MSITNRYVHSYEVQCLTTHSEVYNICIPGYIFLTVTCFGKQYLSELDLHITLAVSKEMIVIRSRLYRTIICMVYCLTFYNAISHARTKYLENNKKSLIPTLYTRSIIITISGEHKKRTLIATGIYKFYTLTLQPLAVSRALYIVL